jgi:hypothetical protein
MPAHNWIAWILAAAVLVLPILLRLYVGDDGPDNAMRQEQPGDDGEERDPEPGMLPLAA